MRRALQAGTRDLNSRWTPDFYQPTRKTTIELNYIDISIHYMIMCKLFCGESCHGVAEWVD
jgi:hypothetical protein